MRAVVISYATGLGGNAVVRLVIPEAVGLVEPPLCSSPKFVFPIMMPLAARYWSIKGVLTLG